MKKNNLLKGFYLYILRIPLLRIVSLFLTLSFSLFLTEAKANSLQNHFSITLNNVTLKQAIQSVEENTPYVFYLADEEIELNKKVSLRVSNGTIQDVMEQLFPQIVYKIENFRVILLTSTHQQKQLIRGVISDDEGYPVIGANVIVKGTAYGTATDTDGTFSLEVAVGDVLQVSYIGFIPREWTIRNFDPVYLTLSEDHQALEEVIIVGYGTEKKVNVIGSIAQIGTRELQSRSTPLLSNALTGQMPGVTVIQRSGRPGQGSGEIRIRGVGSVGDGKSDALVLVDGIPGSLNDINTEDVESISVLKDASAAAIYGARAANGVILVTTKTGQEGKISITYNGYVGFNKATEFPDFVDTWRYAELFNEASGREVYTADDIRKFRDGSDPDNYANARYLEDVLSRNGFQTGHDITMSGGNNKNRYMISFGYISQDGLVEKNNFSRYNLRVNMVNEILPGLTLTSRLSGVNSVRKEPVPPAGEDITDMMGIIHKAVRFPGLYPNQLSDGSWGNGPEQHGTPVSWIKSNSFYERPRYMVTANMRLDYTPIRDLKLSIIGAYDLTHSEEKKFRSTHKLTGDRILGPSTLSETPGKTIYKTFQATADYNKAIGKHHFGILAGYAWEENYTSSMTGFRDKFPSNDLPYLSAGSPDNQQSSGTASEWAIQSLFGRAKYNYDERYLFESTVRYDGSSRFPNDNKYGFFPSLALGWRLSEEKFIKENEKLDFINNLKFKASWGKLGNQNIGIYPYQSVYVLSQNYPFGDTFYQGAAITAAKDPTIKWEETRTTDIGFESVFWNGLLSFDFSYFYRKTYDILYQPSASVSNVLGMSVSEMNTGKLKNYGWEFEAGHRNRVGKVGYNLNANLTILNNELLTLGVGNVEQLNGLIGNGSNMFIGYPLNIYYGYLSDGVFLDQNEIDNWYDQSKVNPNPQPGDIRYKDVSGPDGDPDGVIDPNYDRVVLGSNIPRFTFGLTLGVDYKGFDLSALIQGVADVKGQLNNSAGYAFYQEGNIQTWQADGRFDPAHPVRYPDYPRLEVLTNAGSPNTVSSDFWVLDASYVRLRNIQLGYTLPKNTIRKIGVERFRVYVQAENPLTWNKYRKGWDPEINSGGNYYPILATYTLGVNFKF